MIKRLNKHPSMKRFSFFLRLVVSVGTLSWLLTWIPVDDVWRSLRTARPWFLVAGVGFFILTHWMNAARTYFLARHQGMTLGVWTIFRVAAATSFYKLALPGGMGGGMIRWYKLSRPDRKPFETVNVMIYDRIIHGLVMVWIGVFFMLLDWPFAVHEYALSALVLLLLVLMMHLALYLAACNGRFGGWIELRIRRWVPTRFADAVHRLASSSDRFGSLPGRYRAGIIVLTVCGRLANLGMYYLFALSLGLDVPFSALAWVRTVVFLMVLLPVSISGLGVREGSMVLLLRPYGVEPGYILALSMLVFISVLLHAALGAFFEISDAFSGRRASGGGES